MNVEYTVLLILSVRQMIKSNVLPHPNRMKAGNVVMNCFDRIIFIDFYLLNKSLQNLFQLMLQRFKGK